MDYRCGVGCLRSTATDPDTMFDYLIIGGGSAGCVLAVWLSEDPDVNVALLEAGPVDSNVLIHCPAGLALLAWANPLVYRPVFSVWMVLVFPVGWMMSRLVLAMVYFVILTPIGLVLRWRGHDPLSLKDAEKETYWEKKDPAVPARRYLRQY